MTQDELREKISDYVKKGTQKYIAEITGVSVGTISKFKRGKFDLYPELFDKLCAFFEEGDA